MKIVVLIAAFAAATAAAAVPSPVSEFATSPAPSKELVCEKWNSFACDEEVKALFAREPRCHTTMYCYTFRGGCPYYFYFACGVKRDVDDTPLIAKRDYAGKGHHPFTTAQIAELTRSVDAAKKLYEAGTPANTTTGYSHLAFLHDFYGGKHAPEGAEHNSTETPGCVKYGLCDI